LLCACLLATGASAAGRDDRYLEGYVSAVIDRELAVLATQVTVRRGVARIVLAEKDEASALELADLVGHVDGITRVEVRSSAGGKLLASIGAEAVEGWDAIELLPRKKLFDPLLADPRQPHFSAMYQWYLNDRELTHVGSANFGETVALVGGALGDGRWELGLLGGVFSIFDLDAESYDLVNTDFWIGPTLSVRRGPLSAQVRVYHQSSHLGDEFLLRNRARRVNLSYEGVDLLVSAQVHPALRVYAGGGMIVHDTPDLDPWSAQVGAELRSPVAFVGDRVRPIAGFDFQARQENDWREEFAAAGGLELANAESPRVRIQLLASWFKGNSPNGQFFQRRIESISAGARLVF
jgi:hypothetical protein